MSYFLKTKQSLERKFYTIYNRLIYLGFLKIKGKVIIEKRVTLKPFWHKKNKLKVHMNNGTIIKQDVIIQGSGILILGENSYIGSYCVIGVNEYIKIGRNVMMANCVTIRDTDHKFDELNTPMIKQGIITASVVVNDNVWIGHGVVITKGVTIESGAVLAANSVITKNVPKNAIVGGVPAKIIKYRNGNKN